MTICIAALSDNGAACVVAADRQMTVGGTALEFEHHESKIDRISDSCFALSSGSALVASEVVDKTRQAIAAAGNATVHQMAEMMRDVYMTVHLERVEHVILLPRGWRWAEFKQFGAQQIPVQAYIGIDQQIFNFGLQTEFIVAGVDASGGHIGWIHYHGMAGAGWLEFYDKIGYQAIGSGASHASILLSLGGQHKGLPLAETVYNVYVAKKNAEVAPGVGNATDLGIVSSKGLEIVSEDTLKKLDELKCKYESHKPSDKELKGITEGTTRDEK
jgi:20S proteasome alpha/beta subunit